VLQEVFSGERGRGSRGVAKDVEGQSAGCWRASMSGVLGEPIDRERVRGVLTDRDKQLIGYLAIARYLSFEQVLRVAFPGRKPTSSRRRLLRLAGEWSPRGGSALVEENFEPPFLRRRRFRTFGGDWREVWALTEAGYVVSDRLLGREVKRPREDVSAEFLEHEVALNSVLVGLIDPAGQPCPLCHRGILAWSRDSAPARPAAPHDRFLLRCSGTGGCGREGDAQAPRAEELPFHWVGSDTARLPWTDYDMSSGRTLDRQIRPDAVLETRSPPRRLFLECEMGTHTIVPESDDKKGATIAKVA
jgi:hypothetical protein